MANSKLSAGLSRKTSTLDTNVFSFVNFIVSNAEHGGTAYTNSVYIPQAKGKTVSPGTIYALNGSGLDITNLCNVENSNGMIRIGVSYAPSNNLLGLAIQCTNLSIS